jgi:SAM-dependent methyltransferase
VDREFRFVRATGVDLDEETRREAVRIALREGVRVLDLVPADLPATQLLAYARNCDTRAIRAERLALGRTAGHALLVEAALLTELRQEAPATGDVVVDDPAEFAYLAAKAKKRAPTGYAAAVLDGLRAHPCDALARSLVLGADLRELRLADVVGRMLFGAGLILSFAAAPAWGAAALLSYAAQPRLLRAGTAFRQAGLREDALRPVIGPHDWYDDFQSRRTQDGGVDRHAARRPEYAEDLSQGLDRFFEERRPDCPWCSSTAVEVYFTTDVLAQLKPGRTTLERCRSCGHIFQNPRLSLAGLDFYYRDYYDGIGAELTAWFFRRSVKDYRGRVELLQEHTSDIAHRWLDVGTGSGHFCQYAKEQFPDTRFEGLDMGDGVEEAERSGWVSRGYRGSFVDLSDKLSEEYDVLTMNHYLEHTREPGTELDAAVTALAPGGLLFIELPDPEYRLGHLLGKFWAPWFQPQHQHMIPVGNLEKALEERGLTVVARQRGEVHQGGDLTVALGFWLMSHFPDPAMPWRAADITRLRRIIRGVVWTAALPGLVVAAVLDAANGATRRRRGSGNAYRVLARKAS